MYSELNAHCSQQQKICQNSLGLYYVSGVILDVVIMLSAASIDFLQKGSQNHKLNEPVYFVGHIILV